MLQNLCDAHVHAHQQVACYANGVETRAHVALTVVHFTAVPIHILAILQTARGTYS